MKRFLTGLFLLGLMGAAGASPLGLDRIYPVQQKDFESFQQKFNSNFGYSVDKNFNKLELTLNPLLTGYATGDILYASSTSSLAKLNIGSAGKHLVSRGGIPSWEALPSGGTVTQIDAGYGLTGAPITTTGTLAVVLTSNYGSMATSVTSASDITDQTCRTYSITASGTYLMIAKAITTSGIGQNNNSKLLVNTTVVDNDKISSDSGDYLPLNNSWLGACSAGDTVSFKVSVSSTNGTRTIYGDNNFAGATSLTVIRLQ